MVKKLTKSTQCASNSYYLNCKQTNTYYRKSSSFSEAYVPVSPAAFCITMDECTQCAFIHGDIWWPKKAETCRRLITCLYISVSNYSAVVGIHRVNSFTARNMNNVK